MTQINVRCLKCDTTKHIGGTDCNRPNDPDNKDEIIETYPYLCGKCTKKGAKL